MMLLEIWLIGIIPATLLALGLVGLVRRAVPWRHSVWAALAGFSWPLVLLMALGALLLIMVTIAYEWRGDAFEIWGHP